MSKIKENNLEPLNDVPAVPIGICIPLYNAVGNKKIATAVWSLDQGCDLPYQLSLGVGPNCVAKNRLKALARLDPEIAWVLMADDDIIAPPHFASRMVEILMENPDIGAVSAVMQGDRGQSQNNIHPSMVPPGDLLDTLPPGTFIMYNRIRTPIEWDINYLGSQWEDTDAMKQVRAMGQRTVATGDVQIVHLSPMTKLTGDIWKQNKAYFLSKWPGGIDES